MSVQNKQLSALTAISPLDGRYRNHISELSDYSSEFGLIKYRTEIEIKFLIALSRSGIIRKLSKSEIKLLERIYENFSIDDAVENKDIAQEYWTGGKSPTTATKHDVKAVEYVIKNKISKTSLKDIAPFIHFGLTTWDINNIAHRLMIRDGLERVVIKAILDLNKEIINQAIKYKKIVMIGRTHGQAAVPTTLGKELLVFYERIKKEIKILKNYKLTGKLNGAVGNFNALHFAYPNVDWQKFSDSFINGLGLIPNKITTQINPYEDIIYVFQTIQRINGILLGFDQDMWRYISDGWFVQENIKGEVGSSTMPQKINPIMFENSEGNLVMANSIIDGMVNKLPTSRLQRDLTDSTISRNFGVIFAYSLVAYKNSLSGLLRVRANEEKIKEDLNDDFSILSEALQVHLKKEGTSKGYELTKEATRGKKLNQKEWIDLINSLDISDEGKEKLASLTPEKYIGIAEKLFDASVKETKGGK